MRIDKSIKSMKIVDVLIPSIIFFILILIFFLYTIPVQGLETCATYNSISDEVTVKCDMNFKQLAMVINDSSKIGYLGNGEWLLNTTISINPLTTFSIEKNEDTYWIKMTNNHALIFRGKPNINGVKITSWDSENNTIVNQTKDKSIPRAYISFDLVDGGYIKNSDIGYIGYKNKNNTKTAGVSLYKSHDILLFNNKFHDIYYAFYSANSYNVTLDSNEYYHNLLYAIDPHTRSHDFKIINNHIHNNYKFGIIFSYLCYNFLVENNTIHDNNEGKTISYGIFFSRMATNSTARNNTIWNESVGIDISQSSNNFIYDNHISKTDRGIFIFSGVESNSTNNYIQDNEIKDSKVNVDIRDSTGNIIKDNTNSMMGNILVYIYNTKGPIFDFINRIKSSIFGKTPTGVLPEIIDNNTDNNTDNNSIELDTNYSQYKTNNYVGWSGVIKPKATVIFTFDDDSQTVYDNAYPVLKANNQTGVIYAIINRPDNFKGYIGWNGLRELYDSGWDVSSHTVNHVDLRTLDDQRLNYELNTSQKILLSEGFNRSARFIAYPFGGFDDRVINAVKANGYLTGRTVERQKEFGIINLAEENALYKLRVFEVQNITSIGAIKNVINTTIQNNGNLILVYHIITPDANTPVSTKTSQSNFKLISDYIASRKNDISVITMSEYYWSLQGQNATKY